MSSSAEPPRVLIIPGSIRSPSYTRALCSAVGDAISTLGADVELWDTVGRPLPIADPAYHRSASAYPDEAVVDLDRAASQADAFVFASPIYHNSYSGVLKNIIDLLNIEPHFRLKAVGLLGHGGGRTTQAVDHLRIVARGLNAVAIPTQVCTQQSDFNANECLASEEILCRVHRFAAELIAFALQLKPIRSPAGIDQVVRSIPPR